jgi:hypothetical protein
MGGDKTKKVKVKKLSNSLNALDGMGPVNVKKQTKAKKYITKKGFSSAADAKAAYKTVRGMPGNFSKKSFKVSVPKKKK